MGYVFRLCVIAVLVVMFVGCGGNRASDVSPLTTGQQPAAGQFNLPGPVDALALIPDRTSSELQLERNGSDYVPGLTQWVTDEEPSARFNPNWTDSSSGIGNLAYAIFSFNVQTYFGAEVVTLGWGEVPLDYSNLWVGIGNWPGNHWDWYPGPADGTLDLQAVGYGDYTQPGTGDMLVAVVMLGTDAALLDMVSVGESSPSEQGDWWMFGHDRQHTRRSPFVGAQTNNLKWTFDTLGNVESSAAIGADGTVYVGSHDFNLYAINPDGTLKWAYLTGDKVDSSPAIGYDGTIYVGSRDKKVYAINLNGTLRWTYTTGDMVFSSPVIGLDGTVYVASWDKKLYAINSDGILK